MPNSCHLHPRVHSHLELPYGPRCCRSSSSIIIIIISTHFLKALHIPCLFSQSTLATSTLPPTLQPFPAILSKSVLMMYNMMGNFYRALICSACVVGLCDESDNFIDPCDAVTVERFQRRKIVVLGGSGFVGSAICKAAVGHGFEVVSLSRSGRPPCKDAWVDQAVWIAGDVFYADWDSLFNGATAAVSTIGGFGLTEQMEKLNGEANLLAINAALNGGVQKFILVSVHDYNVPDIVKTIGNFDGKRKAEAEVLAKFANAGTVLRPGFIYGRKTLNGLQVPLDVVGGVWDWVHTATQFLTRPLTLLPASDLFLAPPVSVNDVAAAAIKAVIDDEVFGIYTIEQIKDLASSMQV